MTMTIEHRGHTATITQTLDTIRVYLDDYREAAITLTLEADGWHDYAREEYDAGPTLVAIDHAAALTYASEEARTEMDCLS